MTDPIADFLARVNNAMLSRKATLEIPASNMKRKLAELLRDEGFLSDVAEAGDAKEPKLLITLRWDNRNQAAIQGFRRASRPGQRLYVGVDDIPTVRNGLGVAIISTSKGLMTDRAARKARMGGEVVCEVW